MCQIKMLNLINMWQMCAIFLLKSDFQLQQQQTKCNRALKKSTNAYLLLLPCILVAR